jgi:hypothetical protein
VRVFARVSPENHGIVVAIVVDMRPLLAKLRLLVDDTSALLVIGAHGAPAPTSDPELAAAVRALPERQHELPQLARLMDAVVAREATTVLLGEVEAKQVGLPHAVAVAVAAPVVIQDGSGWSVGSGSAADSRSRC